MLASASPDKQRLELAARHFGLELAQARLGFGDDLLIVLGLAELDQGDLVVEFLVDAGERRKLLVERGTLLHHPARTRRVVPEIGVFGLPVQLGKAGARFVDVKDASSAARRTA